MYALIWVTDERHPGTDDTHARNKPFHGTIPLAFTHQQSQLFPANCIIPLKNGHHLMAARCHNPEISMPLQPPTVNGRVPQVLKSEIFNPCPLDSW